jgi:NADPH-dependent ferric siderophore reductase
LNARAQAADGVPAKARARRAASVRHRVLHKVVVEPADVDTVIYHGGCYDGVGAAWAAWRRVGDKASYHGMQHRQSPPKVRARVRACACVFRAPSVADCEALRR